MILFVGDKPSAKMKPDASPFEGAACEARLDEWIAYLIPQPTVCQITNSAHWEAKGRITFDYNIYHMTVIALGNEASRRLKIIGVEHFKLPHPSGRNRQVNNKKFIKQKLNECKQWLKNQK